MAPTLTYSGNAGSYGLLSNVNITCTATNDLSGVASSTCANAAGPAWTFGGGTHLLSASATDQAGNAGTGATAFTVTVKPADPRTLTTQLVQGSAKDKAAGILTRLLATGLVEVTCNVLLGVAAGASPIVKGRRVASYAKDVQPLVGPGWLTQAQANALTGLAGSI